MEKTQKKKQRKEPKKQEPTLPYTQKDITGREAYQKILYDLVNDSRMIGFSKGYVLKNLQYMRINEFGQPIAKKALLYLKAGHRGVRDAIANCFEPTEVPIPTLDVLSCYMEHGTELRKYSRLIEYQDTTKIVDYHPTSKRERPQLNIPEELFDEQNITKAKQAGIKIDGLIEELTEIKNMGERPPRYQFMQTMTEKLAKYCPVKLKGW